MNIGTMIWRPDRPGVYKSDAGHTVYEHEGRWLAKRPDGTHVLIEEVGEPGPQMGGVYMFMDDAAAKFWVETHA